MRLRDTETCIQAANLLVRGGGQEGKMEVGRWGGGLFTAGRGRMVPKNLAAPPTSSCLAPVHPSSVVFSSRPTSPPPFKPFPSLAHLHPRRSLLLRRPLPRLPQLCRQRVGAVLGGAPAGQHLASGMAGGRVGVLTSKHGIGSYRALGQTQGREACKLGAQWAVSCCQHIFALRKLFEAALVVRGCTVQAGTHPRAHSTLHQQGLPSSGPQPIPFQPTLPRTSSRCAVLRRSCACSASQSSCSREGPKRRGHAA